MKDKSLTKQFIEEFRLIAEGMLRRASELERTNNPKPEPRQLKPGDFAEIKTQGERNGQVVRVMNSDKQLPRCLTITGGEMHFHICNLTPIDTLTEEHLKMLNTDEVIWSWCKRALTKRIDYIVERISQESYIQFQSSESLSKAIELALRSEISRRYVDRMIGGKS